MESKTILCDIDGCLIEHQQYYTDEVILIDGTKEKIKEWDKKGYRLILTTGRRESAREITEKMLSDNNITYDQLIMGLGPNVRVLINDKRPDKTETAIAINVDRNKGIKDIDI
jgi:ribonucleotide monophosphatase NagD (HAD superfamily)